MALNARVKKGEAAPSASHIMNDPLPATAPPAPAELDRLVDRGPGVDAVEPKQRLSIDLPKSLHSAAMVYAAQHGIKLAAVMRAMIEQLLAGELAYDKGSRRIVKR